MSKKIVPTVLSLVLILGLTLPVLAEMRSDNYRIPTSVFSCGGGAAESVTYKMNSIVGQVSPAAEEQPSSTSFTVYPGGWHSLWFALKVEIDIKPGSYPNSINLKSRGVVPVAVLTTDSFDASTVDPDAVQCAYARPERWTLEDVDGDDDLDLLFHFETQHLGLTETSSEATVTGNLERDYGATFVWGTDTVNIVPKGKKKKKGKKAKR